MQQQHPFKQLADLYGKEITVVAESQPIENSIGEPIGMTSPLALTGGLISMIITQREADDAGLAYDTPGLTIVNAHGDIIARNEMED